MLQIGIMNNINVANLSNQMFYIIFWMSKLDNFKINIYQIQRIVRYIRWDLTWFILEGALPRWLSVSTVDLATSIRVVKYTILNNIMEFIN